MKYRITTVLRRYLQTLQSDSDVAPGALVTKLPGHRSQKLEELTIPLSFQYPFGHSVQRSNSGKDSY